MKKLTILAVLLLFLGAQAWGQGATDGNQSIETALGKGAEAIRAGHYEDAERWFKTAAQASPDNPMALMGLGVAELRLGRTADAVDALQKAVGDRKSVV